MLIVFRKKHYYRLTKTQFVLPKLIAILGENPFALDEAEIWKHIMKLKEFILEPVDFFEIFLKIASLIPRC